MAKISKDAYSMASSCDIFSEELCDNPVKACRLIGIMIRPLGIVLTGAVLIPWAGLTAHLGTMCLPSYAMPSTKRGYRMNSGRN